MEKLWKGVEQGENQMTSQKDIVTKKIFCWPSPGCHSECGLLADVDVKNNKIVKLRPNPDNPVSQGWVCRDRFPHHLKWLYAPFQLMYPLKRVGARGEGKWERISWDQAMDEIASALHISKSEVS